MSEDSIRARILNTYSIAHWGEGYIDVSGSGEILVRPQARAEEQSIGLHGVIRSCRQQGLSLPLLLRFPDILRHRVNFLCQVFDEAAEQTGYRGAYTAVYPIKVNQQRAVVEALVSAAPACHENRIGLEAGSKPELLAVLSVAPMHCKIICNGYKDREFVRLALLGEAMGHPTYVVVEKPNELTLLMEQARSLGLRPKIGVRVRLASIGKGNWQNTGGEKSKFGLSASQLLELVAQLADNDMLDCLNLLHFHLGSQIGNLRDIQRGLRECARFFQDLCQRGAKVQCIDVGGGLGIDYEGTRSRNACSANYSPAEYALHVLRTFRDAADEAGLEHPEIITESGRALTAHHAILVADVIDRECPGGSAVTAQEAPDGAVAPLRDLLSDLQSLEQGSRRSLVEIHEDAAEALSEIQLRFLHGGLDLTHRALAENSYLSLCRSIRGRLNPTIRSQRELRDRLNEKIADRVFVNFSLFQSLPDIWGIDQIFPIVPLNHLDQPLIRRAILQDITCDSDGRIDHYVDSEGIETTLPMPEPANDAPQEIGFFLVGAYQEILGDMHNLFGDTDTVDVRLDEAGAICLEAAAGGDSVRDVLRYVNYDPELLLRQLRSKLVQGIGLTEQARSHLDELAAGLSGYTYFEE